MVSNIEGLRERIEIAFDVVRKTENTDSVLRSTVRRIIHPAHCCIAENGNNFEYKL